RGAEPSLVLASTSPYRRVLLERLGVPFRCRPPLFDERRGDDPILSPKARAELLARGKCLSLVSEEPGATILGADQLVALDGHVHGKPGSIETAIQQLAALAGRTHELITALAIYHSGRLIEHTDVTRLTMRPLARDEIERYVAADLPLDCAGSYK